MYAQALDRIAEYLDSRLTDGERKEFETKFGHRALAFLVELPNLFHFYRRVPYDWDVPASARHLAGTCALYIAEHQDFLSDRHDGAAGLIDDVYVAFAALPEIVQAAEGVDLGRHWRGQTSFEEVVGMAHNVGALDEQVPSKVLEGARRYLGFTD